MATLVVSFSIVIESFCIRKRDNYDQQANQRPERSENLAEKTERHLISISHILYYCISLFFQINGHKRS